MTHRFTRMFVLAALSIASTALSSADASAQVLPSYTFDAISTYSLQRSGGSGYQYSSVSVTGVQHGASAASTLTFSIYTGTAALNDNTAPWPACEKQLLVAINRPGRFSVTLMASPTTTTTPALYGCTLTQLP